VIAKGALRETNGPNKLLGHLHWLKDWDGSIDSVPHCSQERLQGTTVQIDPAGRVFIQIDGDPVCVSPKTPLVLRVEYSIHLHGRGPRLHFGGALQPSDVRKVKKVLNLRQFRKTVVLAAHSQYAPFGITVFNASRPSSYPDWHHSFKQGSEHRFRTEIRLQARSAWRAKYFSMAIDWLPS
jgi:hypothetical protein